MNKAIGYIIGVVGIIVFILSYPTIRAMLKIPFPAVISDIYLTVIGVVLLLIGAYLALRTPGEQQHEEVPIYHGRGGSRKIVGYQRE